MAKRFRPKLIHIYLHPNEDKFLRKYAEKNYLTISELIRGWIHEAMKHDGFEINQPSLPKSKSRRSK